MQMWIVEPPGFDKEEIPLVFPSPWRARQAPGKRLSFRWNSQPLGAQDYFAPGQSTRPRIRPEVSMRSRDWGRKCYTTSCPASPTWRSTPTSTRPAVRRRGVVRRRT